MYDYFIGKVVSVADSYIVLEVNNVGYRIYININKDIKLNYFIKIYIYNYVSDFITLLYGFVSKIERDVFIKLLEVKKIGIKSAFLILKQYSYEELLLLVNNNDESAIMKIPKITKDNINSFVQKLSNFKYENSISINREFLSILRSLEYPDKDIFSVYKKLDTKKDINLQVKDAIKLLEGDNND